MLLRLIIFRLQKFLPIFPYSSTLLIIFQRHQVPTSKSRILRCHLRVVTLISHSGTDITLLRMAVGLAAILAPQNQQLLHRRM